MCLFHKIENPRTDIKIVEIPATEIANELGNSSIANMVCLGALIPSLNLVDLPKIEKAIKKLTSKRPETFDSNLNAINKGIEFVK